MRVAITVPGGDAATVGLTVDGQALPDRPVHWAGGLLLAAGTTAEDAAGLVAAVTAGTATAAELARYGQLLFDAAVGAESWAGIVGRAGPDPLLELAVVAAPDAPAQSLHWEALHDGAGFVAVRGAARAGRPALPVALVRLVPAVAAGPVAEIARVPRVLFAVGSRLTDPDVRPGAEFMGILRQLEREGGAVQARTLESATVSALTRALRDFRPDLLHLVGHGQLRGTPREVRLQLRPEPAAPPGDEWVPAATLLRIFQEAGHTPTVVVLSACQTAGGDELDATPYAARLVAGGVPVTVAMAGDVADTACRVFTRALTTAVESGAPLIRAVGVGRAAAFWDRPDPDSTDWVRPVLFLRQDLFLSPPLRLVDDTALRAVRQRVGDLGLARAPVFFGRQEFVDAFDRLLQPDDPLAALVAYTDSPLRSYGGFRLLQELGARAVRAGRLPLLLGPFDQDPPTDLAVLAEKAAGQLLDAADNLGIPRDRLRLEELPAGFRPRELAIALRADLADLARDAGAEDAVLLCHRVDRWADAVQPVLELLGPKGFGSGTPLPVVLTGAVGDEPGSQLKSAREGRHAQAPWVTYLPLGRFGCDDAEPEDGLAYQWWLLNPPSGRMVYAARRNVSGGWVPIMRQFMADKKLYEEEALFSMANLLLDAYLVADDDLAMLKAYGRVAP